MNETRNREAAAQRTQIVVSEEHSNTSYASLYNQRFTHVIGLRSFLCRLIKLSLSPGAALSDEALLALDLRDTLLLAESVQDGGAVILVELEDGDASGS